MRIVRIELVQEPDWGWHLDDSEETAKLMASLHRHGQIQSLLVRTLPPEEGETEYRYEIIDGRRRLNILKQLGTDDVWICDLGRISREQAIQYALSLELVAEIDYARLAEQINTLKDTEVFDSLPMTTPFSAERIRYFGILTEFDWSQYSSVSEQAFLFDDEEPPTRPAPPTPIPTPVKTARPTVTPAPSQPPPTATNDAAARARARGAVLALIVEHSGLQDQFPDAVDQPRAVQEISVVMGEDYKAPQATGWRPEAPLCLDGIDEIELDCETTGLKWWEGHRPIGISIRLPDGRKQYLPWGHKSGGNLDEDVVKRWAQRELRGKLITGANIKFDNHMLWQWGVGLEEQGCRLEDVQHYAALLDEYRKEFSLDILARDFLGLSKTGQDLDKSRMADYHAGQVAEYACHDVHLVGELKKVMLPLMAEQDLDRVRLLESEVIYPVCEMERNAAHVNRTRLKEWVNESAQELQSMLFDMAREVGFQMNPDKSADWQRLFEFFQIPIPGHTAKGAPSFADALLQKIPHPAVQRGRRIKSLSSLRSKFLTSYNDVIGADNKLRFALHQLRGDEYGTARGRFSMSGASKGIGSFGANLQQVFRVNSQREAFGFDADDASHDHEIYIVRSLFEAEQGDYLSADAQSIEYRLAAHFADSEKLITAYQADVRQLEQGRLTDKWVDFHRIVGDFINPVKRVTRNVVKNTNFCLVYGGSDERVAETLDMSREESDPICLIWRATFPEFKTLQRKAESLAKGRGFVRTLAGRRARFPMKEYCHAAINYVIQGSAADIMKQKLVELHRERKDTGLVMRQTVHDEVDGDALTSETAQKVRVILNRQSFPQLKVPIVWEVSTGKNWAEAH